MESGDMIKSFPKQIWTFFIVLTLLMIFQEIRHEIDEINSGEHDNMTYEDIAANFPVEFALRDRDKLNYRYPKVNPSLRIRSRNYSFRYFIRPSLLLQLKSLKNRCWINIFFYPKFDIPRPPDFYKAIQRAKLRFLRFFPVKVFQRFC